MPYPNCKTNSLLKKYLADRKVENLARSNTYSLTVNTFYLTFFKVFRTFISPKSISQSIKSPPLIFSFIAV